MSNPAFIKRTVFQTIDADGKVVETTYGFRVFDDHAACYDNTIENFEILKGLTLEQLVAEAENSSDIAAGIMAFAKRSRQPILVDDVPWYAARGEPGDIIADGSDGGDIAKNRGSQNTTES